MIKTVRREDSVIGGNGEKELGATGAKYIATRLALYIFGNENKSLGTCFDWEIGWVWRHIHRRHAAFQG